MLLETESVNMFPLFNPYSAVVYSANASNVDSVWVQGRLLVQGHRLTEMDLQEERERLWSEMSEFKSLAGKYQDVI